MSPDISYFWRKLMMGSLRALVPELTSYERREVRDVLNQDTYQMDIITSLPLELVLIIFQHLDLWELFSLQRVCLMQNSRPAQSSNRVADPNLSGLEKLAATIALT